MKITRQMLAEKIAGYLHHEIQLSQLVAWAESAMMDAGIDDERDARAITDVLARLGLADVRAFGLTWDDCEALLARLGYTARVEIVAA